MYNNTKTICLCIAYIALQMQVCITLGKKLNLLHLHFRFISRLCTVAGYNAAHLNYIIHHCFKYMLIASIHGNILVGWSIAKQINIFAV